MINQRIKDYKHESLLLEKLNGRRKLERSNFTSVVLNGSVIDKGM